MEPPQSYTTTLGLAAAALIVGVIYFFAQGGELETPLNPLFVIPTSTPQSTSGLTTTPGVERFYTNDARTFSFRLPDGFNAPEFDTEMQGVTGMMLEKEGREPLLVLDYRVAPMSQLTVATVRESLPGTTLTNAREIIVQSVVRGLLFETENGLEVWMIHNGHLYRLLTPKTNQDLLDFVISNWYFAPPTPTPPK